MFTDTMQRWLATTRDHHTRFALTRLFYPVFDRMSSVALTSPGLAIHGAASALVKTGASDTYFIVNGVLVKIVASTDLPALVGTVTNAKFNVFCFFVDSAGAKTVAMGTEGATLAKLTFPQFTENKALIGFIIVNPTGTGNFVGGTTALDDATVVPNVVYINGTEGFDPYVLTGLSVTP